MEDTLEHITVLHILTTSFLDNHNKLIEAENKYAKSNNNTHERSVVDECDVLIIPTIISATLLLEGFINEYGASGLKIYFDKYLDRMDLLSKWVVIPRLIEGINLDEHPRLLSRISMLISARNRLVHPKIIWIPKESDKAKLKFKIASSQWSQMRSVAKDSILLIRDIANFMNKQSKISDWPIVINSMTNGQIKEYRKRHLTRRSS